MPNGDNIPNDIVQSIATSTAISVGEQPAILANLALANQIANINLAQQNALSNQQAMFQLELTIVSKCVEMISSITPSQSNAAQQLEMFNNIMKIFSQLSQSGAAQSAAPQPAPAPAPAPVTPDTAQTAGDAPSTSGDPPGKAGKK